MVMLILLVALAQDDAARCVERLLEMQEKDGSWPYEGAYRVKGDIPLPYRIAGTSLVGGALLQAAPADDKVRQAVDRGLAYVLKHLGDPRMDPSTENEYDVRIWGQAAALEFLAQVPRRPKTTDAWIERLIKIIALEELPGGGWNYAWREAPASFVTVPVVQALLFARGQGFEVSRELLDRAKKSLEAARADDGAFLYSGRFRDGEERRASDDLAGSAARAAGCEATLRLLGAGSAEHVQGALNAFHDHWADLEKRYRKPGAHEGPHQIAPYYFFFGHRYAAQAVQLLPEASRPAERERLARLFTKTRDADGTWNDRVFDGAKSYGTTMAMLAFIGDKAALPPPLKN
jgi:hypothetical protein